MRQVHPAFDTRTQTWFTGATGALNAEAPRLDALKALLPADVEIVGYYPLGTPVPDPRRAAEVAAPPSPEIGAAGDQRAPTVTASADPRLQDPAAPAPAGGLPSDPDEVHQRIRHLRFAPTEKAVLALLLTRDLLTKAELAAVIGRHSNLAVPVSRVRHGLRFKIKSEKGVGWRTTAEARLQLWNRLGGAP